jgi:transcriptional regulator of acetoin/glycerol metabolism
MADEHGTERTEETVSERSQRRLALVGVLPGDTTCVTIEGKSLLLGRDEQCDLRLERTRVSRRHAEIYRQGPIVAVRDLGSTNGTQVNGRRNAHSVIVPGSLLRVGDWLGLFEALEPEEFGRGLEELAPGLWGGTRLAQAFAPLKRVAGTDLAIVLVGATGTGKERFAGAAHHLSGRAGRFHALNCAALPEALAEGELFGYQKGAFTNAERAHTGQLRAADGGTLLLDEIGDLPLPIQAKLLRALESKQVLPLGETRPVPFDARIIAATQRPLDQLIAEGSFRSDLAGRLQGLVVTIPPLAERRRDVPALFHHFLREHSGGRPPPVSTRLYEQLCLYAWPMNVRELELLARQLLFVHGLEPKLRRSHLPEHFQALTEGTDDTNLPEGFASRDEYDLHRLTEALRKNGGNVSLAAKHGGISRQRAYRLMKLGRANEAGENGKSLAPTPNELSDPGSDDG